MRTRRISPRSAAGAADAPRRAAALGAFCIGILALAAACQPTHPPDEPAGERADSPDPAEEDADPVAGADPDAREGAGEDAPDEVDPGEEAGEAEHAPEDEEPPEAPREGSEDESAVAEGERIPMVDEDHDQFGRVEGQSFDNDCESDADCHVGGCSNEVCSAEPGVTTTCEMPREGWASQGGTCGCVEGACRWYTKESDPGANGEKDGDSGASNDKSAGENSPYALEGQGEPCDETECEDPLSCVSYYGVAGQQGPEFTSCEVRCDRGADDVCPEGQACVVIADGPGEVCRPKE